MLPIFSQVGVFHGDIYTSSTPIVPEVPGSGSLETSGDIEGAVVSASNSLSVSDWRARSSGSRELSGNVNRVKHHLKATQAYAVCTERMDAC